jgi:hypothetical protein
MPTQQQLTQYRRNWLDSHISLAFYPIRQKIDFHKFHLKRLKALVHAFANDYRVFGHCYHSMPMHIRYHDLAKKVMNHRYELCNFTLKDASRGFVVSSQGELPEMIVMIGTFDLIIKQVDDLLAQPAESVDLQEVKFKLMTIELQIPHAWDVMTKLLLIMTLYFDVVIALEKKAGRTIDDGSMHNSTRTQNMMDKWFAVLPAVCFYGYPEAFVNPFTEKGNEENVVGQESGDGDYRVVVRMRRHSCAF